MKIAFHQWWPWRRWRVIGCVDAADEVPNRLPRAAIVVVGQPTALKWAAFDCPCRGGHRILLPLSKRAQPHWTLDTPSSATLSPSVDAWHDALRCHYFIRQGKTVWVDEPPRTLPNRFRRQSPSR